MRAIAVLLACLVVLSVASADVKNLKSSNFDSILKDADMALVKFFAPWCGHCKKLAPEFKTAAEKLDGKFVLAEVNCDEEKELCSKHGVQGYPTLQIFRKGEKSQDYEGGRSADDIVKYMTANSGPAFVYLSSKEDLAKLPELDAKVLVMTSSKDSKLAKAIERLAPSMRMNLAFGIATDKAVAPDVEMETVTVYRSDDDVETFAAGANLDTAALSSFLKRARVPMLGAVDGSTIQMYNELSSGNLGWLFLDSTNRDKILEMATKVAKKYRKDLIMLWVDTDQFGAVAEQLAVPKGSKYPAFVIDKNRKHHVQPLGKPFTEETMSAFIEAYLKGDVKASLKSDPVPAKETVEGMTTLVGSRFRAMVDAGKDMMVLFYAPWCGHCKNFHPVYDKVAKALEKSDVIIAKMDATTNDVDSDDVKIEGFPTIYFWKAGDKSPIPYSGSRDYDDVMSFIKSHAASTISAKDAEVAKDTGATESGEAADL